MRVFKGERSGASLAGWYQAFSLFVTEELKTNERFRSIFFATELVDIRRAVDVIDQLVRDRIKSFPDLSGFMADVQKRLDWIEQGVNRANDTLDRIDAYLNEPKS